MVKEICRFLLECFSVLLQGCDHRLDGFFSDFLRDTPCALLKEFCCIRTLGSVLSADPNDIFQLAEHRTHFVRRFFAKTCVRSGVTHGT